MFHQLEQQLVREHFARILRFENQAAQFAVHAASQLIQVLFGVGIKHSVLAFLDCFDQLELDIEVPAADEPDLALQILNEIEDYLGHSEREASFEIDDDLSRLLDKYG